MSKTKAYGFTITNSDGHGFQKWFTETTKIFFDNDKGKLPEPLNQILITQEIYAFPQAMKYCKIAAVEHGLNFNTLTEEDWNNANPKPFSKWLKKLKRNPKKQPK